MCLYNNIRYLILILKVITIIYIMKIKIVFMYNVHYIPTRSIIEFSFQQESTFSFSFVK